MKEDQSTAKRYALLQAARDSEYVLKMYGGYFNVFVAAFGGGGEEGEEQWDLFRVVEGDFPKTEELHKYDGFVISGSVHDAYGNDFWILRLCFLIQKLHAMQKRILGICFGHQVLCRALGGQVAKARNGWDVGVREVIMAESLFQCRFLDEFGDQIPPCAKIIECHQDEVLEVPPGAEVLAFSNKTGIEMFCYGDHILGIQGHPEYTKDILANIVGRLTSNELLDVDLASDAKAMMEAEDPDRDFWEKFCKWFLKGM